MRALTLIFLMLLGSGAARAQSTLYGIPNFQTSQPANTLQDLILGATCTSMPASPLELSCNPAFLASEEKRQFRVDGVTNDRIGTMNKYRHLLEANDSVGLVDGLLQEKEPLMANASVRLWYQRDWWAIGVTPVRAGYVSFFRNSAYPEITGSAFADREVFAKAGMKLASDENLRVGLQLRYVDRSFFRKQFALLDAVNDQSLIRIDKQQVAYLEPGVSYALNEKGTSALSAMISQMAVYQGGASQPLRPVFDLGYSSAPDFFDGRLKTSTHVSVNPDIDDTFAMFRAGLVYDFDFVSVLASFASQELGAGVQGRIDSLVLGLGYRTQEIAKDSWQKERVSSWLFEIGLVF